jgi:hypothetical protein
MERGLAAAARGVAAIPSASYTFKDARGVDRPCEVVRRFRKWGWRRGLPEGLRTYLDLVELTLPRASGRRKLDMVTGALLLCVGPVFLTRDLLTRGLADWSMLSMYVGSFGLGIMMLLSARRAHGLVSELPPAALVLHTADAGFCPGCLYDLSAAPRQEDGVCVCPECAAAWRIGVAGLW